MKKIPLTRGLFALVDDEDYEWLSQWKWHASFRRGIVYPSRGSRSEARTLTIATMHRDIMRPPAGLQVDHINGDTLDNRRTNLRVCRGEQNARNRGTPRNNTSGFKGVSLTHRSPNSPRPWRAEIGRADDSKPSGRKREFLGHFASAEEAARAYDAAALKYHGEFARLNFPTPADTK